MAIVALHSAATGLSALAQDIDVIANNIANTNTNGFRALRSNFEDLLYLEKEQPGVENRSGDQRPAGLFVGLGTKISNTQLDLTPGPALPDSGDFSMMIDGRGFFQVALANDQIAYTRAGNFLVNSEGDLVLGNSDGRRLMPQINIPQGASNFSISSDGTILAQLDGDTTQSEIGQLQLADFVNPTGLKPVGGNLYIESAASGPAILAEPESPGFGKINHKFLEASNVDPVRELIHLIKTQRHFEFNSQSIEAADQTMQVIARLGQG